MDKIWFAIPPLPPTESNKFWAFAVHDKSPQVYTFTDSAEDIRALSNLIRSGDVIELVYGTKVSFEATSAVDMMFDNKTIQDVVKHGYQS